MEWWLLAGQEARLQPKIFSKVEGTLIPANLHDISVN